MAVPQSLAGSEWRPIEIAGQAIPANTNLFIRFEAESQIVGHSGCNHMFGTYTIDNTTLRIRPLATSRMACDPEIMALESAFTTALEDTRLYLRNATKLTFKNAQGGTTLRLVQTDWD